MASTKDNFMFLECFSRFHFLCGMTGDRFCSDSLRMHNLESLLLDHLRAIGYRRVVFHSRRKQIHFLDAESYQLARPPALRESTPVTVTSSNRMKPGPLGPGIMLASLRTAPPAPAEDIRWNLGAMTDSETVDNFAAWLADEDIPTALVFRDGMDLLEHFDQRAVSNLNNVFFELGGAGPENDNICIIIFSGSIHPGEHTLQRWHALAGRMVDSQGEVGNAVIAVSSPDATEVANLLHRFRLLRGTNGLDCASISLLAPQLSRSLRAERAELKARIGDGGTLSGLVRSR
ncbi:MAG: hypothetical protein HQL80_10305 [Magnetococcales bacterium]|nr:hypothetical protein [Magnetococcales bacterium]